MGILNKAIKAINTTCAILSEGLVFLLMIMVSAEIIGRHVFNNPIPGHVESATLFLILIIYLGLPFTQSTDGHIRVSILTSSLSERKALALEVCTLILSLIVSLFILWATTIKAISSVRGGEFISGIVNFPVWPGRCAVVFGFFLLAITLISQIVDRLILVVKNRKESGRHSK